jgi:hypothetical protein
MKKLVMFLIALNCFSANADGRYAHEYSSDDNHEQERDEWYESETRGKNLYFPPRYQQPYQQPRIQIYMQRQPDFYPHDRQTREDNRWRQRRYELQQMPQTPYYENQFDRDDTHW